MKLLLFILLISTSSCLYSQTGKSIFLIPKDYKGLIFIFFSQPNSDTLFSNKAERIFNIPDDGIFLTKSRYIDSYSELFFYYVDSLGYKTAIKRHCPSNNDTTSCTSSVKTEGGIYKYYRSKNDKKPIDYIKMSITDSSSNNLMNNRKCNLMMAGKVSKKLNMQFKL